jgi:MFS family permease
MSSSTAPRFTLTHWLIIIIASIGFLFDTYELLMTPLVAAPAIAELLGTLPNDPAVTEWVGKLLTISAVCGGIFGLLGGWLVDKLGRKTVMTLSIFVYSLSPFCAAYATSLPMFVFFRSTTFIGVCVEFVAAITWLAEVFEDKKQKERWLGITQAFASLGGVAVTLVSLWISKHLADLPQMGLHAGAAGTIAPWRYTLMTGLLPAIPIALLLPFVPESKVWREKRAAGALQRPSFAALFAPALRRVTLVTAVLSACAYGIAFGALQVTVARVTPGLPELKPQAAELAPLRKKDAEIRTKLATPSLDDAARTELRAELKANFGKQAAPNAVVKQMSDKVQFRQEMGGLVGRVLLAILLIVGIRRVALLKVFQLPALIILPLTFFKFFDIGGETFLWAYALCGLVTVAQFSYFGEYLPKVFPLHLRGTGGSFATNVGGRMIGTSMATLNTAWLAPLLAGGMQAVKPMHVALAAGYIATAMAVIAFLVGFLLPEPKAEITE